MPAERKIYSTKIEKHERIWHRQNNKIINVCKIPLYKQHNVFLHFQKPLPSPELYCCTYWCIYISKIPKCLHTTDIFNSNSPINCFCKVQLPFFLFQIFFFTICGHYNCVYHKVILLYCISKNGKMQVKYTINSEIPLSSHY